MDIIFYNTSSEKNAIHKVLTGGLTLQGAFRSDCSIINPVFTIESSDNFTQFNYVHIPEFERYYFILNIISKRTNLWEIHLHVDVLMSFKDYLFSSRVLIVNSELTAASKYLESDSWVAQVRKNTTVLSFPNGFENDGEFILITAGGV